MATETPARRSWGQAFAVYGERPVLSMLFLGFSAGLPFYLVFSTLSAWLRTEHIERATIGMLSWVGLMYSFKWVWAPVVDRVALPVLDRLLGRRRSWMLIAQIGIAICLANLALSDPGESVLPVAMFALGVAFFAATQDIAIDAWRIESATADKQGAMAAAYQIGYRTALMVASAGALIIAGESGFRTSYLTMAALVSIGVVTTLLVREPVRAIAESVQQREERVVAWLASRAHWPQWMRATGAWFMGAMAGPVVDFFGRYGLGLGLLIFAFISTYRLTDYVMGTMTNPFYIDMGFTVTEVGVVAKFFGWPSTLVGAVLGGVIVAKVGRIKGLLLGSVLVIISNVFYATYGAYACHAAARVRAQRILRVLGRADHDARPGDRPRARRHREFRQSRARRARHRAHRLHVEPHQREIHRDAVRGVVLAVFAAGQTADGHVGLHGRRARLRRLLPVYGAAEHPRIAAAHVAFAP